jgi:hypothetical protein
MPGEEVRVKVRQEHVADPQPVSPGLFEVRADVPPRVDDDRRSRIFVTY